MHIYCEYTGHCNCPAHPKVIMKLGDLNDLILEGF